MRNTLSDSAVAARRRWSSARAIAVVGRLLVAACVLEACAAEKPTSIAPELPATPALPAAYRNASFTLSVNATRQQVTVSAPSASLSSRVADMTTVSPLSVQPSLLGADAIDLVVTNFRSGVLGAVAPGKIQVLFDIQVINRLASFRLSTPTFPTPPSGVVGVLAFPIEIGVLTSPGGVGSSGNQLQVSSPRFGSVVHDNEWDGALHNFFNDTGCPATATDCFRYEPFGTIDPLASSAPQQVGFLIDPTVGNFIVKVIVGADLVAAAPPLPGVVRGTVTSNIGPLAGAVVTVTGGGTATTSATGAYSLANVPSGSARTVSLQALPSGCVSLQPTVSVNVPAGATVVQDFVASCTVPTASIQGTVRTTLGAPLAGVQVVVTPTGGTPIPAVTTDATGAWQVSQVPFRPADSGIIALANLPAGCSASNVSYSALDASGLTRSLVVTCAAPTITYPLTATWGSMTPTGPTGRQVTLTLSIDMGAAPGNSDIDGSAADALTGLSLVMAYDGTLLDWTSRQLLTPGTFDIGDVVESNAGGSGATSRVIVASTAGASSTGVVALIRLTFNVTAGASGTVTPQVTLTRVGAGTQDIDVTSRVTLNLSSLVVP